MTTLKTILVSLVVAVLVVSGAALLFPQQAVKLEGNGGSEFFNFISFFGGFSTQKVVYTPIIDTLPAAATTTTITASQICDGGIIEWAPTTNNATATFDTSANIINQCLTSGNTPYTGSNVKVAIWNTAATTTFNVVLAANETFFHASGNSTTTITSSTPAEYTFYLSLYSSTSTQSSTLSVFQSAKLTP